MARSEAILKKLGQQIRVERERIGVSSERLAYEVGISKGNLSEIERGLRDLRFTTLVAIAGGLGMSVSQLTKSIKILDAHN